MIFGGEDTMDFVAIDVETANPDLASICQIGVVSFDGTLIAESWGSIVNPEDYFADTNISVHGITEEAVEPHPNFATLHQDLAGRLAGKTIVSHTSFDRVAVAKACQKYSLPDIEGTWLDCAKVVRRAWPEFARRGYGLKNVTQHLGIEFTHHDALEDARAVGQVLARAVEETGLSIEDWLDRVNRPIQPRGSSSTSSSRIAFEGNPEGPLYGEVIVFTGALSIPRKDAAAMAAAAGCEVSPSVRESTTLLVVGDQDIRKLAGHSKSSKHRKAEKLIARGQPIRIIGEGDFQRLVGLLS
jgi:DNA polymerase-3 subunit epsilon